MKRIIVVMAAIAITAISLSAKSGNTNSLDDIYYGQQKGDFAFSFGIMPTINFIGYIFSARKRALSNDILDPAAFSIRSSSSMIVYATKQMHT